MSEHDTLDPPVLNVVGEFVAHGPLRQDLLPLYHRWMNDLATVDRIDMPPLPMTVEAESSWYDGAATTTDYIPFTIHDLTEWRAVGTCTLTQFDHLHGTAGLMIHLGDPAERNKGYGTDTVRLLLDVAFTALGLHNVMLSVDDANQGARRAYEKAGFKEIGRRRQAVRATGLRGASRRTDEIFMDCLATEFESPVLAPLFAPDETRP